MQDLDRKGVAGRIRALIGRSDDEQLTSLSHDLGVEELALRMSIDEVSPHPTIDVMIAVVRRFGVDPSWLLTGEYDPATHRRAANHDSTQVADVLREIARKPTPARQQSDAERVRPVFPDRDEAR